MTNQHPITPPPELVKQWASEFYGTTIAPGEAAIYVATKAARWGADQELEACCEWLEKDLDAYELVGLRAVYLDHNLHAARRPKPPSLKEQALEALGRFSANSHTTAHQMQNDFDLFRRALEALD